MVIARYIKVRTQTLGRDSKYDSGTSISDKALVLIVIAALSIWCAHSRVWFNCLLEFSLRPAAGTRGTGSHHFSSCLWIVLRKEEEPSESGATIPWSTYQNSVFEKLSNISCNGRKRGKNLSVFSFLTITNKTWEKILYSRESCCQVYEEPGDWWKYQTWACKSLPAK